MEKERKKEKRRKKKKKEIIFASVCTLFGNPNFFANSS